MSLQSDDTYLGKMQICSFRSLVHCLGFVKGTTIYAFKLAIPEKLNPPLSKFAHFFELQIKLYFGKWRISHVWKRRWKCEKGKAKESGSSGGGGAEEEERRRECSGEVPPAPVTLKANTVWESVMNVDSPECSVV